VELLQKEVSELKQIQQTQVDVLKVRRKVWEEEKKAWEEQKKAWEVEKESLKEGKRKVEYALYEVFTPNDANKEKLRKLKEIMDE
jgi:hypothetical protein